MSQFWALMWDIKPGSEQRVADLFAEYGRPDFDVTDDEGKPVGKLLSTQVFLKDHTIVRVIEVEGNFADVAKHMARQPAIRELERQLDEHLAQPRDMSTPEGARAFFQSSMMRPLIARRADD
jgi:hypothetical protein